MAASEITIKVKVAMPLEDFRFRSTWRGKLILQRRCERRRQSKRDWRPLIDYVWRDATTSDLQYFFIAKEFSKC